MGNFMGNQKSKSENTMVESTKPTKKTQYDLLCQMELDAETDKKFGSILAAFVGDSIGSFNEGAVGVIDKQ